MLFQVFISFSLPFFGHMVLQTFYVEKEKVTCFIQNIF